MKIGFANIKRMKIDKCGFSNRFSWKQRIKSNKHGRDACAGFPEHWFSLSIPPATGFVKPDEYECVFRVPLGASDGKRWRKCGIRRICSYAMALWRQIETAGENAAHVGKTSSCHTSRPASPRCPTHNRTSGSTPISYQGEYV